MSGKKTAYEVLNVARSADSATITAAFRAQLKAAHPDKLGTLDEEKHAAAAAQTREIIEAYEILGNAAQRATYDAELNANTKATEPAETSARLREKKPAPAPKQDKDAARWRAVVMGSAAWLCCAAAFAGVESLWWLHVAGRELLETFARMCGIIAALCLTGLNVASMRGQAKKPCGGLAGLCAQSAYVALSFAAIYMVARALVYLWGPVTVGDLTGYKSAEGGGGIFWRLTATPILIIGTSALSAVGFGLLWLNRVTLRAMADNELWG
jgi:hypothetical protein